MATGSGMLHHLCFTSPDLCANVKHDKNAKAIKLFILTLKRNENIVMKLVWKWCARHMVQIYDALGRVTTSLDAQSNNNNNNKNTHTRVRTTGKHVTRCRDPGRFAGNGRIWRTSGDRDVMKWHDSIDTYYFGEIFERDIERLHLERPTATNNRHLTIVATNAQWLPMTVGNLLVLAAATLIMA